MKKIKFSKLETNESFKVLRGEGRSGEIMQPHLSNKDAFILVSKGSVLFKLDGADNYLAKDDCIHIPKNLVHSFKVIDPCEVLLTLDAEAKIQFV